MHALPAYTSYGIRIPHTHTRHAYLTRAHALPEQTRPRIRIPDTHTSYFCRQVKLDEDKAKYPFVQLNMVHPNMGFDPKKNAQAKLQLSLQVL